MAEQETWKWQETGTAWRGVGIYHVTLVVPSRESLLGRLVIPESDPKQAVVERTEMGKRESFNIVLCQTTCMLLFM